MKQVKRLRHQPSQFSMRFFCKLLGDLEHSLLTRLLLVVCAFLFMGLVSCAPTSETASRPQDNLGMLANLIKTSNPNIEGIKINTDNSDPNNPKLTITGLMTNRVSGDPVTATINIDQDKGIITDPVSLTVTAPGIISPHEETTALMVTFGSEPPISHAVTARIGGASVSEWFTTANIDRYAKATFVNQQAMTALAGTTLSITGRLTNSATGTGEIAFTLPDGFASDPATIEIPNPDGTGAAMSAPNPNKFTIIETGNTENSQEYTIANIELAALTQFTPGVHIKITDSDNTDITTNLSIMKADNNVIRIEGLTNNRGTGTYTLTIVEEAAYFTTGGTAVTRTITDPTEEFSPGMGVITDAAGTDAPTFEITNVGESATTYRLEVVFRAAPVSEWFTMASVLSRTYIKEIMFAGRRVAVLMFDGTTISLSDGEFIIDGGIINVPNGTFVLTTELPSGYVLDSSALKDPDGPGLAEVTRGDAGMITISEIGNTDNSETYPVRINLLEYRSPLLPPGGSIMATYEGNSMPRITRVTNIITISGFTNRPGTANSGTVTFTVPSGYAVTPASLPITDPQGAGAAEVTLTDEVVVTDLSGVLVPHSVTIRFDAYQSPLTPANIMAMYAGLTAIPSDIKIETNMITISGFTNKDTGMGTAESGEVRVTSPNGYAVTPTTPITISDPTGGSATTVNLGEVTVTNTTTMAEVSHPITIEFFREIQLKITSLDINSGTPMTVSSGAIVSVTTTACQLLASPTVTLADGTGRVAEMTPFPRYYDRERDSSNAMNEYSVTRRLTVLDDSGGVLSSGFTITLDKFPACTNFAGGDGTEASPWRIDSAPRLELASHLVNNSNSVYSNNHYDITASIDMSTPGLPFSEMGSRTPDNSGTMGKGFVPIGSESKLFRGTLDCAGYGISGLYMNRPTTNFVGLVGYASNGNVSNCAMTNVKITGRDYVGSLVGRNNDSSITTSHATAGAVTGNEYVGGLVGIHRSGAMISNSYATGSVTGTSNVGGLVGESARTSAINDSYAEGAVTGSANLGGLVGYNSNSSISNSYAIVTVTGSANFVGGLIGFFEEGNVLVSYATGAVNGNSRVGGLVGLSFFNSRIINSYATGAVTGESEVGSLVGSVQGGTVNNSYAIGAVTGRGSDIGGLVGKFISGSTVTTSYWNTETTGQTTSSAGTGRTTAQMQVAAPVTTDPDKVYENWGTSVWKFASGRYPRLIGVVCANRQDTPDSVDCTDTLQ
ncbi:hypothetical protein COTS27_00247 [Spirochaetota bacterium]|nr:hypothetical protein COTS27_00247 [Spirochaetota bacterium]